ncbi:MAG: ABC transporter substrate-binding protein [Haloechinothrix sp.]
MDNNTGPRRRGTRRRGTTSTRWLGVLVVAGLAAAASSSVSASGGDDESAAAEPVELLFWDSFEDTGGGEVIDTLIEQFEAANPGVTINRQLQDFDAMRTILRTSLAAGEGPDVFFWGPGAGFMGPLIEAELLLPLDDYADEFGWRDRIFSWTFDSVTFDDTLYGLGNELEYIGVYYNTAIFEELGLEEPETFDELVDIAETVKAEGITPFAFTNQPGWPAFHLFSTFANNLAGADKVEDAIFGDTPWTDPAFVEAIQIPFVEWADAGYYISEPNSLDYEQGNNLFYTGEAAMQHTGTWLVQSVIEESQGFEPGFFTVPAPNPEDTLPAGGMGSAAMVSSATEHPDEAAAFIDLLYSDEAAELWLEVANRIPPVEIDTADLDLPDLFAQVVDTVQGASTGDGLGLGFNIDVLTSAEFNTAMLDGFQAVLVGQRTAEEQAQVLQEAKEAAAEASD